MVRFTPSRTLALAWAFLCLAGGPAMAAPHGARIGVDPTNATPTGGDLRYSQLRSEDRSLQTYSLPVILPLEANLGRLSVGSSVEYVRKEYRTDTDARTLEGPGYFSLEGRFRALERGNYRLDLQEAVNVPMSRDRNNDLPPEAWLSTGGYVLDSGLNLSYLMRRTHLSLGLQHSWRLAHREYNPGESVRAALIFGFGFGNSPLSSLSYRWPVSVTLGLTSHYTYADRLHREVLADSERGAVFVSPGINYSGSALNLWADVEIPFYQLRTTETGLEERMRGRIGMRYFFR